MSLSPTASTDYDHQHQPTSKRRRTSDFTVNNPYDPHNGMAGPADSPSSQATPQSVHIPKRGARACTACRKGKNRCEGEVRGPFYPLEPFLRLPPSRCCSQFGPPLRPARVSQAPCRRCQLSGTPCVFEKPEKKNVQAMSSGSVE
ncbi:hypothetical protein PHLCEN_2v269 [Hermanssonia centrifuga]|uniref:Zn(2)-C6 fungal-type domain-containing protein n=1 Tax=Hermanssonia centrifuga TaxID=98765 RepID=A0A2R6S677_9APHY|nr:hypothetical protein PHLCEN_2v269 [Hermanssonia centrifuga]